MKWIHSLCIPAIILLSACGGGGGGGGGDTTTSSPPKQISLQDGNTSVAREEVQIIEVSGIDLSEETYTGSLDGKPILLVRALENSLFLLLPADLSSGDHNLEIWIHGKKLHLNFQSTEEAIAPRDRSLAELSLSFDGLRMAADEAIAKLQNSGGDQDRIDELIANRDALNINRTEIQNLTDEELHYINQFFSKNLMNGMTSLRVQQSYSNEAYPRGVEECRMRKGRYVNQFIRMVASLGLAAAAIDLTPTLGPIGALVGIAGSGIVVGIQLDATLIELHHLVEHCINPVFNSLEESLVSLSTLAPRTTQVIDDETRTYEHNLAKSYRIKTKFSFLDDVLYLLPDAKRVVNKISFIIPDSTEKFFKERLSEDYSESLPVNHLSLKQISDPSINGELISKGEDNFDLKFSKNTGHPFKSSFTFVLYDNKNDIETRYTARLWSDGHCPEYTIDLAHVVLTPERCIVIQKRDEIDTLDYQEYRQQGLVMREQYIIGQHQNINLKTLKGLDDDEHDHIPDLWVERIDSYHEYQVLNDLDNKPSVRMRKIRFGRDDGDQETLYSQPLLQNHDGYYLWDSVTKTVIYYYDDHSGPAQWIYHYSDPLQDDDEYWHSVLDRHEEFDIQGNLTEWTTYATPSKNPQGKWVTVAIESYSNHVDESGEVIRGESLRHPPVFSDSGKLQAPEASYKTYKADVLTEEIIFSSPLKNPNGNWESVRQESFSKSDHYEETHYYSIPLLNSRGHWISLPAKYQLESNSETTTEIHSEPLQTSWGDWESVIVSNISEGPLGPNSEHFYSEPLQATDGSWQSVSESAFIYSNGEIERSEIYSDPIQLSNGFWDSAPESTISWSGDRRSESTWSQPLEQGEGAVSTLVEQDHYLNDSLTERTIYSQSLLNNDGTWTSIKQEVRRYSAGLLADLLIYWSPTKRSDGYWDAALKERSEWYNNSKTEYKYSTTLHDPSGDHLASVIQNRKTFNSGVLKKEDFYAEPYLDDFNTWATYLRRTNYYARGCYVTRNQTGEVVTDTC